MFCRCCDRSHFQAQRDANAMLRRAILSFPQVAGMLFTRLGLESLMSDAGELESNELLLFVYFIIIIIIFCFIIFFRSESYMIASILIWL